MEIGRKIGEAVSGALDLPFDLGDFADLKWRQTPEGPPNPEQLNSVEGLGNVVGKIDNPSDNEEIVPVDVVGNDDGRKTIVLGIAFKDMPGSPHSTASASVKGGVMSVSRLPIPRNPEVILDDPSSTKNSDTLLSALVETARRSGCKEVVIPSAENNSTNEQIRETMSEAAKKSGWDQVVSNFVRNFLFDPATKATERVFDNPADKMGFEFDGVAWRLKLKD